MPRRPTGNDRRLKRGDGWIVARPTTTGETRYLARWREPDGIGGTRVASRTFPTKDAAESHLRTIADKLARGAYVAPDALTVNELVTRWIDRGVDEWKASTVASYRSWASSLIAPALGAVRVTALTAPRVQSWVDRLKGTGSAPSTIHGALYVLQAAYNEAIRLGIVDANPVRGTRRPSIRPNEMPVWSAFEVKTVLDAVADDPKWNAALRLHVATGMRPGEIQVLRWSDLDLKAGTVTISRTMTKNEQASTVIGTTTKTGKVRAVALPGSVVEALVAWRKDQIAIRLAASHWTDLDLIFTTEHGKVIARNTWAKTIDRLCEETGVTRVSPHGIRHTCATLLLEQGVHPKVVAEILGHQSIVTTLNTYSHISLAFQRTAIDGLDIAIRTAEETREETG